jgi:hypothetical protein
VASNSGKLAGPEFLLQFSEIGPRIFRSIERGSCRSAINPDLSVTKGIRISSHFLKLPNLVPPISADIRVFASRPESGQIGFSAFDC